MIYIRSLVFNILAYSVIGLGCIANSAIGLFNKDITIKSWNYVVLPTVAFLLKHIAKITIEVRGKEYLNQDYAVYAGKHQSAVETYTLTTFIPKATYVMKKELTKIPVFGWAQAFYGIIPVDRSAGSAAMKTMLRCAKEMVEKKRPIIIFPEGTRTKNGEMGRFKQGAFKIAMDLHLPVVPISLVGFYDAMPRNHFYVTPFSKVQLHIGKPIDLSQFADINEAMEHLRNQVQEGMKKRVD